jgi:hypothetical protein
MRAIHLTAYDNPAQNLRMVEVLEPNTPSAGEALVRMRPASLLRRLPTCSGQQRRTQPMEKTLQEKNKATVLKAFDTLFNKRDYAVAEKFWSPHYKSSTAPTSSPGSSPNSTTLSGCTASSTALRKRPSLGVAQPLPTFGT